MPICSACSEFKCVCPARVDRSRSQVLALAVYYAFSQQRVATLFSPDSNKLNQFGSDLVQRKNKINITGLN
jgi:hypothetical protein